MEKISFAYVSRILEGSPANLIRPPDNVFIAQDFPQPISFSLYAGIVLEAGKPYSFKADIFLDNRSLIENENIPGISKPLNTMITPYGDFLSTSLTDIMNIRFNEEGLHEVRLTLYGGYSNDTQTTELDTYSCFILIRKGWSENE